MTAVHSNHIQGQGKIPKRKAERGYKRGYERKEIEMDFTLILQCLLNGYIQIQTFYWKKHRWMASICKHIHNSHINTCTWTEYSYSLRSKHKEMKDTGNALWGLICQDSVQWIRRNWPISLHTAIPMTVHASKPGSQNKVSELCSYCRHSWNYLCKFQSKTEPPEC